MHKKKENRIKTMDDVVRLIGPQPRDDGEDEELDATLFNSLRDKNGRHYIDHPACACFYERGFNYQYNRSYQLWLVERDRLRNDREWSQFITRDPKKYWLGTLDELHAETTAKEWANCFRVVWYGLDHFWEQKDEWRKQLMRLVAGPGFMSPEERAVLAAPPDVIEIFRGSRPANVAGFSWTTEYEKAEYHAYRAGITGKIYAGKIQKIKIIAILDREEDEKEVIVFPEDVTEIEET